MNHPSQGTGAAPLQDTFLPALREALAGLEIELEDAQLARMQQFATLLLAVNERMNLTSITDPHEMAVKHFADSLSVLQAALPEGAALVDVGSGGGLPGIPLAIARPDLEVVLLDATRKKVDFLNEACGELGLDRFKAVAGRAESLAREPAFRETFDVAVWRGLGMLKQSAELCLPLVKPGGVGIAMKGPRLDEELGQARAMIGQLGGKAERNTLVNLGGGLAHRLLIIRKERPTPGSFPRTWTKIRKGS